MKKELSDAYLRTLTGPKLQKELFEDTGATQVDIFDTGCRNLSVRANKNHKVIDASGKERMVDGKITFYFNFTAPNTGTRARFQIGEYSPELLLLAAQAKVAGELRPMVEAGKDPRYETKRVQDPTNVKRETMTMVDLGAAYIANCRERGVARADEYEALWLNRVNPVVGHILVKDFKRLDRRLVFAPILEEGKARDAKLDKRDGAGGGSQANKAFTVLNAAFNFCVEEIPGVIESSPIAGAAKPWKDRKRSRYAETDEIQLLLHHLPLLLANNTHHANILILDLILGGQRICEICGMAKDEFDLKRKIWIIPGWRTKNRRPHLVPLSDLAMSIIVPLYEAAKGKYLFPKVQGARRSKNPTGWIDRSQITKRIEALQPEFEKLGMPKWTPHALRHTFLSTVFKPKYGIANSEYRFYVTNQRTETHGGIKGNYQNDKHADGDVYAFMDEKRVLLDSWAAFVEKLMKPKVVPFAPKAAA